MKKILSFLLVLGFGFFLTACNVGFFLATCNNEQDVVASLTSEPADAVAVLLVEDFGNVIETVGAFWTDFRLLEGRFANIDHNERLSDDHNLLLSTDFGSIADVRNYLLQYYTENWTRMDNNWSMWGLSDLEWMFREANDMLYISVMQQSVWEAWETATHELIEQDGNHAVIKTRVGIRYTATGDDIIGYKTFRFTFVGNRIDSGELVDTQIFQ